MPTYIVGILNVTPDSFSDGGAYRSSQCAIDRALQMVDEGADIIDIGGDSTRPGSVCVGVEEEWSRIGEVVEKLAPVIPVSIDTHQPEVARRAIDRGAAIINDVSGGQDEGMWQVIANAARDDLKYCVMFSSFYGRTALPHNLNFELDPSKTLVQHIEQFSSDIKSRSAHYGIPTKRIILDTGMGGFLSRDPLVLLDLLSNYPSLVSDPRLWSSKTTGGWMLGVSRKGFLKHINLTDNSIFHPSLAVSKGSDSEVGEVIFPPNFLSQSTLSIDELDLVTAKIGVFISRSIESENCDLYLRVHNVRLQVEMLSCA
jgi:dihydropteroate synthase